MHKGSLKILKKDGLNNYIDRKLFSKERHYYYVDWINKGIWKSEKYKTEKEENYVIRRTIKMLEIVLLFKWKLFNCWNVKY